MTQYDSSFFAYVNSGSIVSAKRLLPHVVGQLDISSVVDVGCGQGAWLSVWKELGVSDIVGIDGDYVDRGQLLFPEELFKPHDLSELFAIGRKFDLVQCLEVAEHLPEPSAATLVESLTNHADVVLFSAAPPGQGGDHHVNEQPYDYWRALFERRGFRPYDFVRPLVAGDTDIEPWYRYNVFLYASETGSQRLPQSIKDTLVTDYVKMHDVSPLSYKLRKAVVRLLPVSIMTWIAKIKERLVAKRRTGSMA